MPCANRSWIHVRTMCDHDEARLNLALTARPSNRSHSECRAAAQLGPGKDHGQGGSFFSFEKVARERQGKNDAKDPDPGSREIFWSKRRAEGAGW
eukprot:387078-Rhodomonas_salina.1